MKCSIIYAGVPSVSRTPPTPLTYCRRVLLFFVLNVAAAVCAGDPSVYRTRWLPHRWLAPHDEEEDEVHPHRVGVGEDAQEEEDTREGDEGEVHGRLDVVAFGSATSSSKEIGRWQRCFPCASPK